MPAYLNNQEYKNPQEYLQNKGYSLALCGSELRMRCPFCQHPNDKFYINSCNGLWHCFHCMEGGNWKQLLEKLNDPEAQVVLVEPQPQDIILSAIDLSLVEEQHLEFKKQTMLKKWLKDKWGWNDNSTEWAKIGWTGRYLTMPIINCRGECVNIKKRLDPTRLASTDFKGFIGVAGRSAALYNEQILYDNPDYIIICEGEKDCLILHQYGFNAVTTTQGAGGFKSEWLEMFREIPKIYICLDNDKYAVSGNTGQLAADNLASKFKDIDINTFLIRLPDPTYIAKKMDVTNFFIDQKKKREDFQELMANAEGMSLTENENLFQVGGAETENFVAETVYNSNDKEPYKFCVFDKATGKVSYKLSIKVKDETVYPLVSPIVHLPEKAEFVEEADLDKAITDFISTYCWMEDKNLFLATIYIKYSWIFDQYSVVPYLRSSGMPGTGKTRFNDAVGILCYRPVILNGGVSEAALFRIVDMYKPTLVINEFDRLNSDEKSLFTTILNNGYEKGKEVVRVEGEKVRTLKFFKVFCPKIFATIDRFKDSALESRIISLESKEFPTDLRNNYPVILDDEYFEKAKKVRNMLLGFRFGHFCESAASLPRVCNLDSPGTSSTANGLSESSNNRLAPDLIVVPIQSPTLRVCESVIPERGGLKKIFLDVLEFSGRTRQTFYPLLSVLKPEDIDQFIKYVKEYQNDIISLRGTEDLGIIATTIIRLYQDSPEVLVKTLREEVNLQIDKEISPQKMRWHLKKLKIETDTVGHQNMKFLILTPECVAELSNKFIPREEEDTILEGLNG